MKRPVLRNLALALALISLESALIFGDVGFSTSGTGGGNLAGPVPGWVVGLVWTVLFAGIGVARGLMVAEGSDRARSAAQAVLILLLACAAYPFYTGGLRDRAIGEAGDVVTLCLSAWTAARIWSVRRPAVIAPAAVFAWVTFALVITIDDVGAAE